MKDKGLVKQLVIGDGLPRSGSTRTSDHSGLDAPIEGENQRHPLNEIEECSPRTSAPGDTVR